MMATSRRSRRMERNHVRRRQPPLNLVSLMDIFTILVFFLLVNSSNVQQLPRTQDLRLPASVSDKVPEETLVIAVTPTRILVQGREVALVEHVMSEDAPRIGGLEKELKFFMSSTPLIDHDSGDGQGRAITIMGDENTPYELLRKILATCREANYTKIAFAAFQTSGKRDSS